MRREAEFRLKVAKEYVGIESALHIQTETIDALNGEVGRNKTYIHELHLERDKLRAEIWQAREHLEFFIFRLQEALERGEPISPPASAGPAFLEGGNFRYHLSPSPFRLYRTEAFQLGGWIQSGDGRRITAIRVRIGSKEFLPEAQPREADTAGSLPETPISEFEFKLLIPPGRSFLMLEACIDQNTWRSVLNAPLWRED